MWQQNEWQHEYLVSPTGLDPTSDRLESTYDQFIQLRDTLIYTGKKYKGKGLLKLCVWEKEETIEVAERQYWRQSFEPWFENDPEWMISRTYLGDYITEGQWLIQKWTICTINKSGRYRISHKEEIYQLTWDVSKVYCYVAHHVWNAQTQQFDPNPIPRAVFDWEWNFEKTFTWQTTWTDPNGSCSVKVSFKLWDIIQKMTSYWIIEADLNKWDYLEFIMEKQWWARLDSTTYMQPYSNWWQVEYLDLPYNI